MKEVEFETLQSILEKNAGLPRTNEYKLPKRQRSYDVFHYSSLDKKTGVSIRLKYFPDFDPILWFEMPEITLPKDFACPQRKNIVVEIEIWNKRAGNKNVVQEGKHYIPLTKVDELFNLYAHIADNRVFELYLGTQELQKLRQLDKETMRKMVDIVYGEDNNRDETELRALVEQALKEEFNHRYVRFFAQHHIRPTPKEEYKSWFSYFLIEHRLYDKNNREYNQPWKIQYYAIPQLKSYVEADDMEAEYRWDKDNPVWLEVFLSTSVLKKALRRLQEQINKWFAGEPLD